MTYQQSNDTHTITQSIQANRFYVFANDADAMATPVGTVYRTLTGKYRCWRNGEHTLVSTLAAALNHYKD